MEASLLSSKEFGALNGAAACGAACKGDPEGEKLKLEFDLPDGGQPWVLLLDGRGETLDCAVADQHVAVCNEAAIRNFNASFTERIRKALAAGETWQGLERRWREAPDDLHRFETCAKRLETCRAFKRLETYCAGAARDAGLAEPARELAQGWLACARLQTLLHEGVQGAERYRALLDESAPVLETLSKRLKTLEPESDAGVRFKLLSAHLAGRRSECASLLADLPLMTEPQAPPPPVPPAHKNKRADDF